MDKTPINPLSKYFRQPAIYLKLPSNGRYWPESSLELPVTGEIPVYPMTAKDEITLRTPDALMNGSSVVDVIHSCCPSIKDAWKMPSVDVDAILIGIRIASYGQEMNIDTNCPHCNEENNNALDLSSVLSSLVAPDYSQPVASNDLKIKLKPQEFFGINRQNSIRFEEQRISTAIANADMSREDKALEIARGMSALIDLGIDTVTDSTEYIELDDQSRVIDKDFIKEFYRNSDGAIIRTLQEVLADLNTQAAIKPQTVKCQGCEKEYEVPLEFDYANFFDVGS